MLIIPAFVTLFFYNAYFIMRFTECSIRSTTPFLAFGTAIPSALNTFVSSEKIVALQAVLNNIGSDGVLVPAAASGLVIASPSKVDPDCEATSVDLRLDPKTYIDSFQTSTHGLETQP